MDRRGEGRGWGGLGSREGNKWGWEAGGGVSLVSTEVPGAEGRPSSLGGAAQAEVDGQAIQPPFTFNERAQRLLAPRCFMRRRIANTSRTKIGNAAVLAACPPYKL